MNNIFLTSKNRIKEYFFSEEVPMEHKNFFLAIVYAIVADVLMMGCFLFFDFPVAACWVAIGLLLACIGMAFIAIFYGEYKMMTYVFCVVLNIVVYPLFYFLLGDVFNGVCLYFAAGVMLTFFLTAGPVSAGLIVVEIAWYIWILIYSYNNSELLMQYRYSTVFYGALYANFIVSSFIPIFIMSYQSEIYYKLKETGEKSHYSIKNAETGKIKFLANMTHELRTPMNSIVGMNELILSENLNEYAREEAETIKESSDQLLSIINNILAYSKLESGKWKIIEVKYNFHDMIKSIVNSFAYEALKKNIDFNFFIDKNIPLVTYGDQTGIKQVFTYLLYNSIQQNERTALSLEIGCERDMTNNTVKFKCRIAEKGSGISDRDIESLMGAYRQYDSRLSSSLKGMGLEIAICSGILEHMNGNIKIESVVGLGIAINFEFTNYIIDNRPMISIDEDFNKNNSVLILLRKNEDEQIWKSITENLEINPEYAHAVSYFKEAVEGNKYSHIFAMSDEYERIKDILVDNDCEENTYIITGVANNYGDYGKCKILRYPLSSINVSEAINGEWIDSDYLSADEYNISFDGARILLIEDSIVTQRVIMGMLDKYNIKVDTAHSVQRGLELLSTEQYDLIIMSYNLPDMDGMKALQCIRRISEITARIPILCITSEMGRDINNLINKQGYDDYIAKPIKEFHLRRLLQKYIPKEFHIYKQEEKKMINQESNNSMPNPLLLDFNKGIMNVGRDEEIYLTILSTYYAEGKAKAEDVIGQSLDDNLSLFTTNVHALKSSSASVGAIGISEYFKALEFAGKENNRVYIETNLAETLENYSVVLEKIKEYLISKGENVEGETEQFDDGNAVQIDTSVIESLFEALGSFNLKLSEEIINDLSATNYGQEINSFVKEIKSNFDKFEYFDAKDSAEKLLNYLKK